MITNWTFDVSEVSIIRQIAARAHLLLGRNFTNVAMDVDAVHANGCPLLLAELRDAPDGDFAHDIAGITIHLNRRTGKLEGCFLPRYAKQ